MIALTRPRDVRNAPTNRPDDWAAMVAMLRDFGLKSAAASADAARAAGMSIELVGELQREAGTEAWSSGMLANWLTGKTEAPIDEAEARARIDRRERSDEANAESIRRSVTAAKEVRSVPPWVIAGTACRRLRDANLKRFATDDERDAAGRKDRRDRKKQRCGKVGRVGSMVAVE